MPHSDECCRCVCSGTDATHADHIETIKSRMYVGLRPDNRFVPGQLGMGLVEGTSICLVLRVCAGRCRNFCGCASLQCSVKGK